MVRSGFPSAARPPQKKEGFNSCLLTGLIILAVMLVMGGGLVGMVYLFKDSSDLALGDSIGVVEIIGVISESESVIKALNDFKKSDKIKAIVLRIDSPGGGVGATQEIYEEILKVKKKKKVVASMGSVAASGGLYVAAPADKVVANKATITGSIGVIMNLFNIQELLGKIGLSPLVIKSGKYKDIGSSNRPMTDEERELLQGVINELHGQFVKDLATGRGLAEEKVVEVADGRIFTGVKAKELGLVDQLGNFQDAVQLAKKIGGLKGEPRLIYPQKDEPWWMPFIGSEGLNHIMGQWTSQPVMFQYLFLPGL